MKKIILIWTGLGVGFDRSWDINLRKTNFNFLQFRGCKTDLISRNLTNQ